MLVIKEGVKLEGVRPEILLGLIIVNTVIDTFGYETVITEATGGEHMEGSLHYKGLALDIRCKNIPSAATKQKVLFECKHLLGDNYDFIIESEGEDAEHFHLEFDPK